MEDAAGAQAKIDEVLTLPEVLAGEGSAALSAALEKLGEFKPTMIEFGELLPDAEMALDTVCSALLAMRDRALERERDAIT